MKQRTGAGTYLLTMSFSVIVWSASTILLCKKLALTGVIDLVTLNWCITAMGMAFAALFYPMSASRLRDLNFPSWSIKIFSFPLITLIILPLLCFLSGPRWENDYGEQAPKSGTGKTLLALSAFGVAVPSLYYALIIYYGTRYLLAHTFSSPI
ncbi:DUF805 domain-containing protein [Undibacterium sp. KW1]|uniref:DUF805 domain-containing protein n=1 Tax=Undibacterium sp. KW1 TaxID=2058624 RepID=UPI001389E158|nr:DUF805 domain-containing protein [Undibacterium sp. KW1]